MASASSRRLRGPGGARRRCVSPASSSIVALALSMAGSMVVANRQVQLHALQSQLLQAQSTYAEQVGSNTDLAAPSLVATKAGALHLVYPVSVTQVPSTSLDGATAALPRVLGLRTGYIKDASVSTSTTHRPTPARKFCITRRARASAVRVASSSCARSSRWASLALGVRLLLHPGGRPRALRQTLGQSGPRQSHDNGIARGNLRP